MSNTAFEAPAHHFAGSVVQQFADVVKAKAQREGTTFSESIINLAIAGADCERLHGHKPDHSRRKRK